MKSTIVRLAMAFALAIAGSLAWAAPASAANQLGCTTYGCFEVDGWGSGFGIWFQNGDIMRVCDNYADGWSVVVMATFDNTTKYKWHTGGSAGDNPCTDRSFGNLPEGSHFYFRACLGKYSLNQVNLDSCGELKYATA